MFASRTSFPNSDLVTAPRFRNVDRPRSRARSPPLSRSGERDRVVPRALGEAEEEIERLRAQLERQKRLAQMAGSANRNARRVGGGYRYDCLLYTSPSPRDGLLSRMPSSA